MTIGLFEHCKDARQTNNGNVQYHEEKKETEKEAPEKTKRD